jgi:glutathione gamma-glutamylcysteinyltransferase
MVLIMDVARFKYPPHWVPLQILYDAMQPIDEDSGNSRGYMLLSATDALYKQT